MWCLKKEKKIRSQDLREVEKEEYSKKSFVRTCVADLFEIAILYGSVKNVNSGRYTHYLALCTQENHIVWEGPAVRWGESAQSNLSLLSRYSMSLRENKFFLFLTNLTAYLTLPSVQLPPPLLSKLLTTIIILFILMKYLLSRKPDEMFILYRSWTTSYNLILVV